ncbi:MAG: GNAT family N-acetyltransferase [Candidatus Adiutricales bacterium]
MTSIGIVEREMTEPEFARMKAGFDEYAIEHGNPTEISERFGFVAMDGEKFVGCSSGLAYRKTNGYGNWFFITDLFIEKPFRGQGLSAELLRKLEERVILLGIGNIWTWTAGYEAPDFYQKQGYEIFCEMDDWYSSGHSRVGLRKMLSPDHQSNQAFEVTF